MKCEKCNNEYNSQYYFATPTICKQCFDKLSAEEKQFYFDEAAALAASDPLLFRVGFAKLLGAAVLDWIYLWFITLVLDLITDYAADTSQFFYNIMEAKQNPENMQGVIMSFLHTNQLSLLVGFLIPGIYYLLEVFLGASLGKMTLGIQIADSNRHAASNAKLLIRYLLKHIAVFIQIVWILTFINELMILMFLCMTVIYLGFFLTLGKNKQAVHDILSNTAVYHRRDVLQ